MARQSGILMGMELGVRLLDALALVILARYLAPEGFGVWAFAVSFAALFSLLPGFGMGSLGIRDVAREPQQLGRYLTNGLAAKAALAATTLLVIGLTGWLVGLPAAKLGLVLLAGVFLVLDTNLRYALSFFQAAQRMTTVAVVNLSVHLGWLLLALGLVGTRAGIVALLGARVAVTGVGLLAAVVLIDRRLQRIVWTFQPAVAWRILKASFPFALFRLKGTVYADINTVMLSALRGDVMTGWYAVAHKILRVFRFIPVGVSGAALPAMSRLSRGPQADLRDAVLQTCRYLMLVGLPIAAGTCLLADRIVFALFGPTYVQAIPVLRIVSWSLLFMFVNTAMLQAVAAIDQERRGGVYLITGVLFCALSNLILVPRFGHLGAAWTTVLTEVLVVGLQARLLQRSLPGLDLFSPMIKPAAVMAVMMIGAWLLHPAGLVWVIVGSAAVYLGGLVATRTIGREEWALLSRAVWMRAADGGAFLAEPRAVRDAADVGPDGARANDETRAPTAAHEPSRRNPPRRLVFVSFNFVPVYSGPSWHLARRMEFFSSVGLRGDLLTALRPTFPPEAARETYHGFTVHRVRLRRASFLGRVSLLLRVLRTTCHLVTRDSIVHVVGGAGRGFCLLPILVAYVRRVPVVVELILVGDDDPASVRRRRLGWLRFQLLKRADAILVLSSGLRQMCLDAGIPPDRVHVVPLGTDLTVFRPVKTPDEKRALRRQLNLPLGSTLLVCSGRVSERKGTHVLIEVLLRLLSRGYDAALVWVGPMAKAPGTEDAYVRDLQERISREGPRLKGRVIVTGQVPPGGVAEYFRASDLFVFASRAEGLASVQIEAMACGLPAVVSYLPGITEDVIQGGVEGSVVRTGRDVERFCDHLVTLMKAPQLAQRMGAAGRRKAEGSFDERTLLTRYPALYDRVGRNASRRWRPGPGRGLRDDTEGRREAPATVMFLETSLRIGGTEMVQAQLLERLDRRRFRPVLCCLYAPGVLAERMRQAGVQVHHSLAKHRWDLRVGPRLLRLLRKERPEVLYIINQPMTQFWGTCCALLAGVPVRISTIGSTGKISRARRRLLINRLTFPFMTRVRALSAMHKAYLIQRERIRPGKLEIIPNGVDLERFALNGDPGGLRAGVGLAEAQPVVSMVAMLRPEKAHEVFLRSAARVLARLPATQFLIIGDGPERPKLEALARTLGIDASIRFLGAREDVAALVRLCDVGVLSSRPVVETLSNAVLEYMAAGKPVVATRVGSLPELVQEGRTGFLVEPGDWEALAERIVRLLQDRGLAERLGAAGQARVRQHYAVEEMVRQHEALFERLLALRASHANPLGQ